MNLNNQVALVTGAAQGIGKASALALAEAGAHVVVADIDRQGAEATADAIMSMQRKSLAVQADVGDLQQIDRMVRTAIEQFGQIDILLNNAGVTRRADIMDITEADWDRIHRVNAKGVFFCLQRVAQEMITRRSGRIINIASIAGKGYAGASNVAYAASKGAVISMVKGLSTELAHAGISVNCVAPGWVETDMSAPALQDPKTRDRIFAAIPLGRVAKPEELAAPILFLCTEHAGFMTGSIVSVNGGAVLA